jgi:hypothetical protein
MSVSEAEFIHRENIKHFEKMLETETDPVKRGLLLKLLAQETAWLLPHVAGKTG